MANSAIALPCSSSDGTVRKKVPIGRRLRIGEVDRRRGCRDLERLVGRELHLDIRDLLAADRPENRDRAGVEETVDHALQDVRGVPLVVGDAVLDRSTEQASGRVDLHLGDLDAVLHRPRQAREIGAGKTERDADQRWARGSSTPARPRASIRPSFR